MREKGWEERGPKAHSRNLDFGTPAIHQERIAHEVHIVNSETLESGRL